MPADVRSAFIAALVSSGDMEFEGETDRYIFVKRGTTHSDTISIPLPITRIPTYRSTALCENNGEGKEISGDLSIEPNWTDVAFLPCHVPICGRTIFRQNAGPRD